MRELAIVIIASTLAILLVWIVHRIVMQHVHVGSNNTKADKSRAILSMEIVAFGALLAAFVLGEVASVTAIIKSGRVSDYHIGLTMNDSLLVLGTLLASLLIYTAISKLQ